MKALNHLLGALGVLVTLAASSHASTTVNAGSIGGITGPNDLDLLGEIVYAVNFSANDPALTVNGVVFSPDTPAPAGASFVLPLNVAPWQTKPEFGDSLSDNNLEEFFQDIRYADTSVSPLPTPSAHDPRTRSQRTHPEAGNSADVALPQPTNCSRLKEYLVWIRFSNSLGSEQNSP